MSHKKATPTSAAADAAQCLDPTNQFKFLSGRLSPSLHKFVTTYITTCIDENKHLQEQKKQKNVIDGNNIDDCDLPTRIKKASIDCVREQCPNFHNVPNSSIKGVVQSIYKAAQIISESTSKDGIPNKQQYKSAVDSIVQSIKAVFPQRVMFNLMSRWACRLPKHLQRDAINVLVVLSHQLDCPLHDLLLKARTWVVKLETTKTLRLRKQKHTIAYEKNDDSIEHYVNHLHTSVAVLTEDSINESNLYGSKFRMDSVNRPANFKIISNKTTLTKLAHPNEEHHLEIPMIDVNADFDFENLTPDVAEETEEEHQLESNNNLSVSIPIILELNKAIVIGG